MKELSNWGRWGKDDQLGAANLITPAKLKQALALVKSAETVSLSHNPVMDKAVDANDPFIHNVTILGQAGIAVEKQEVSFHGSTFTHLDAFCHVSHDGKLYNGFLFQEVVSKDGGCSKLGITVFKNGIVTRGILLDIPRLKGLPYLEAGTHVYREDVEAWEEGGYQDWPRRRRVSARAVGRGKKDGSLATCRVDGSFALPQGTRCRATWSDGILDVGNVPFALPVHQIALGARDHYLRQRRSRSRSWSKRARQTGGSFCCLRADSVERQWAA